MSRSGRGRARSPASNPVSLFPFLAVLMSAMGALILLLVVISDRVQKQKKADLQGQIAAVDAEIQKYTAPPLLPDLPTPTVLPPLPELPPEPVPVAAAPLPNVPMVPDLETPLAQEIARLESELQKRQATQAMLAQTADRESAQLVELQAMVAELEKLRRDAQTRTAAAKTVTQGLYEAKTSRASALAKRRAAEESDRLNSYAVVPYTGANGTARRPLLLECDADKVVLQPEGVVVRFSDIPGPLGSSPVAAMVEALVAELQKRAGADAEPPYPLLLVRPDGIKTYYAARKALEQRRSDFGYELIAAEVKLAYPDADPTLKKIAEQAIVDAQNRRFVFPSPPGGLFAVGNEGAGGEGGRGEAAGGNSRDGTNQGAKGNSGGNRPGGMSMARGPSPFADRTGGIGSAKVGDSFRRIRESRGGGSGSDTAADKPGAATPSNSPPGDGTSAPAASAPPPPSPMSGDGPGGANPGGPGPAAATGSSNSPGGPGPAGTANPPPTAPGAANGPGAGPTTGTANAGSPGARSAAAPSMSASSAVRSADPLRANPGTAGTPGAPPAAGTANNSPTGKPSDLQQLAAAGMPSAAPGGRPSANPLTDQLDAFLTTPRSPADPPRDVEDADPEAIFAGSTAAPGGMPGMAGPSRTVRRPVTVECLADRVVLQPGGVEVPLRSEADLEPAVAAIAEHVRTQYRRWGRPEPPLRWTPYVELAVRPAGLATSYLLRSGLIATPLRAETVRVDDEHLFAFPEW